jgi:hypothetical protein
MKKQCNHIEFTHFIPFWKKNLSAMILTSLSPSAVPCIESFCDVLPVVLLCCGSGGCVDVPSLLLFVAVVGCVSTGVDGNVPLFFFLRRLWLQWWWLHQRVLDIGVRRRWWLKQ